MGALRIKCARPPAGSYLINQYSVRTLLSTVSVSLFIKSSYFRAYLVSHLPNLDALVADCHPLTQDRETSAERGARLACRGAVRVARTQGGWLLGRVALLPGGHACYSKPGG